MSKFLICPTVWSADEEKKEVSRVILEGVCGERGRDMTEKRSGDCAFRDCDFGSQLHVCWLCLYHVLHTSLRALWTNPPTMRVFDSIKLMLLVELKLKGANAHQWDLFISVNHVSREGNQADKAES
jgi:hypothetical protein